MTHVNIKCNMQKDVVSVQRFVSMRSLLPRCATRQINGEDLGGLTAIERIRYCTRAHSGEVLTMFDDGDANQLAAAFESRGDFGALG